MQRQTKIIATLGPSTATPASVLALVEAGMDVARLNFSHGDRDGHREMFATVRAAASEAGRNVAVMQDISGPKLRVGSFPGGGTLLETGSEVSLVPDGGEGAERRIPVGYPTLLDDVKTGDKVVLADGLVVLEVAGYGEDCLDATVISGGRLSDHKGVAFPDSNLSLGNLTPQDEKDLALGRELGVAYVAASFVRNGDDVDSVASLAGDALVVSKIELAQALHNLDEIVERSFGIMVARGDLGVQLPLEQLPLIQNEILEKSNRMGRVSVTATEMLESMTNSPRPTRAEVTDVANAVIAGTDAVMLSGETAVGSYPAETVATMARICRTVEEGTLRYRGDHPVSYVGDENTIASAVAQGATHIARSIGATTIVAFTETGSTARLVSKYRPEQRVVAFTPNPATQRRLALYWGVVAKSFDRAAYTDEEIAKASKILEEEGICQRGERVVMVAGVPPNFQASTNLVKVHRIGELSGGLGG